MINHIENIIIGKPLIDEYHLLAANEDDWINNEKNKTVLDDERFLPALLVKYGFMKSNSEVKRNRPDLFKALNDVDFLEIKIGKKRLWILVGE